VRLVAPDLEGEVSELIGALSAERIGRIATVIARGGGHQGLG
jgi:hypothetical protein